MTKNEKGLTFLPILFFATLILLYLTGSIPRVLSSRETLQNEWGKYQAERNAEAGVYLGLETWNESALPFSGKSYILSSGTAQVTVKKQSETVVEIISVGLHEYRFKDKITAVYDTKQSRWMNWSR